MSSAPPGPPRFVPTLTEVVQPSSFLSASVAGVSELATPVGALVISVEKENLMVQRVLQRIDLVLERRLREAVGQLILEHTQTLASRLRDEIELVVRESVAHAFEQETEKIRPPSPY